MGTAGKENKFRSGGLQDDQEEAPILVDDVFQEGSKTANVLH